MAVLAIVLNRLVQRGIEVIALCSERRQPQPFQRRGQLVRNTAQRARFQVTVLSRAVEIIQHAQQLGHHGRLGRVDHGLPVPFHPLAVVSEIGMRTLQVSRQFGHLDIRIRAALRGRGRRAGCRRPCGSGCRSTRFRCGSLRFSCLRLFANRAGVGIDPALVGDSHRFAFFFPILPTGRCHLLSFSSSTTSASTTSLSAEPAPPSAPSA
ncbi:Uncharacterised protein [Mycobacteroides abscessus subsp. abscessus]|nr:Uncharacterised protein [Mycobacteroides abscessus subsp. abscessus]